MTETHTLAAVPLAAETAALNGETVFRVPLTGRDGAGKFAVFDAPGLDRIRAAGAQALYLISNGRGHQYVAFLRMPARRCTTAARAVIDAPQGRRVVFSNGDPLDLRTSNVVVLIPQDEVRSYAQATARQIKEAWQAHRRLSQLQPS